MADKKIIEKELSEKELSEKELKENGLVHFQFDKSIYVRGKLKKANIEKHIETKINAENIIRLYSPNELNLYNTKGKIMPKSVVKKQEHGYFCFKTTSEKSEGLLKITNLPK